MRAEADRVAEQVMRMPGLNSSDLAPVEMDASPMQGRSAGEVNGLQTKIIRPGSMQTEAAPPVVLEGTQSSGRSIDPATSTYGDPVRP